MSPAWAGRSWYGSASKSQNERLPAAMASARASQESRVLARGRSIPLEDADDLARVDDDGPVDGDSSAGLASGERRARPPGDVATMTRSVADDEVEAGHVLVDDRPARRRNDAHVHPDSNEAYAVRVRGEGEHATDVSGEIRSQRSLGRDDPAVVDDEP